MHEHNPYQAPASFVEDVDSGDPLAPADRGTRLAAAFLDALIGGFLVGLVAAIAIPAMLGSRGNAMESLPLLIALFLLMGAGVLVPFIWNLVWLSRYGQTIGKRLLKIRIVRMDGTQAGLGRIFALRMLVPGILGAIPVLGPIFALVNICFIFRDDRRCIHDLLADTRVVKV